VILGAIGPVFGDYFSTLSTLAKCIHENGIFLIDDGYISDDSHFSHPLMFKKSHILQQIERAGMELVENVIMDNEETKLTDNFIFDHLKKRCHELIAQHPDKQHLFLNYIKRQEVENDVLENKVVVTTMMIKHSSIRK
jgi:hypothetical protein